LIARISGNRWTWLDARNPAQAANYFPMPADQSLRILVVEDEALLRWSLGEILRRGGHTVIETTSASTARDAMTGTSGPIDIVFLDIRLPDSNDLGLLEEVRRRMPHSAVVMMTAHATPDVVHGALERGAYCVISKPFDLHAVDALVRRAHRAGRPH
jgi:two-component system nitrogen regulation response regulator GlnG